MFILVSAVLIGGCSSGSQTATECYSTRQFRKFSSPAFSSYIMNVREHALSRLDIYIQLPYRNLRFEKSRGGFAASYTMTFLIRNSAGEIITMKEVDRPIFVSTYEESVSPRFDVHMQQFSLNPGFYEIEIRSIDELSRLRYTNIDTITAENFDDSRSSASSMLFLEGMTKNKGGVSLRPILPNTISLLTDSLGIYQELYHITAGDTVTIRHKYFTQSTNRDADKSFLYFQPPYALQSDICSRPSDSLYYQHDTSFVSASTGTVQMFQFYPLPDVGSTMIHRSLSVSESGVKRSSIVTASVFRREHALRTAVSIDEVIGAMRYIMREKEYDTLAALSGDAKSEKLMEFWESRGGIARKIEFEKKVIEANALFTTCVDGSKTAMGIVYIICGVPEYIECRGSYTETWYYPIGDRMHAFQFRRENEHSKTFELTPYSVYDAVWQWFVDRWRRKK